MRIIDTKKRKMIDTVMKSQIVAAVKNIQENRKRIIRAARVK